MFCKICGLKRQKDLNKAQELGVKMCGFIFHPKSPRNISAQEVAPLQTGSMLRVGVFVEQDSTEIIEIMQEARLDFAQLHGKQSIECASTIGKEKVIRVLWPESYGTEKDFFTDIEIYKKTCAYFLFDAGKKGGGSGKTLDFQIFTKLKHLHTPWILAGGLNAQSLSQALAQCQPHGVDCNSALEDAPAEKNHTRMEEVFKTIKQFL